MKKFSHSICVVERLTFLSWVLCVWPSLIRKHKKDEGRYDTIFYIDATALGLVAVKISYPLFRYKAQKLQFRMTDLKDEQGNMINLRIKYDDLIGVQEDIFNNAIFHSLFGENEILKREYFAFLIKKVLSGAHWRNKKGLRKILFIIQVAAWKIKKAKAHDKSHNVLFMDKRLWAKEIDAYAKAFGVELFMIPWEKTNIKNLLFDIIGEIRLKGMYYYYLENGLGKFLKEFLATSFFRRQEINEEEILKHSSETPPKVMTEYYGHLNLNSPQLNSDLFFWQQSSLNGKNVLVSFNLPSDPLDHEKWEETKAHQIEALCVNPKAAIEKGMPTFCHWPHEIRSQRPQTNWDRCHFGSEGNFVQQQISSYREMFDYWTHLFLKHNVKAYITWQAIDEQHCVITNVLRKLGGVSTVYQRSFQIFPSVVNIIDADVVFGFATNCAKIEECKKSHIDYHVTVGYIGDHRFPLLEQQAQQIREDLQKNGAQHIIAYFDENSAEDSRWHTGHEFMQENYHFLFQKILDDPQLGMVIKPKMPRTLASRLGSVSELMDKALSTGRCFIFDEGFIHGAYPPSAAALAADMAIHGHFCSATAGVESVLAGIPTLLLDREGFPMSPLYKKLGKGKVIFTDWESLWPSLRDYWTNKHSLSGLGDWSSILDELDPFRDGKATERVGTYLHWIIEGFQAGLPKKTILADAAQRYSELWGRNKIEPVG